jgi:hypothetical protein
MVYVEEMLIYPLLELSFQHQVVDGRMSSLTDLRL